MTPEEELAQHFEEPPPEDPGDGAGGEGGEPGEPAATTPPPPAPTTIKVGDYEASVEELTSLIEFQNWAQANPDKMEAFGQYLRGEASFVVPEAEKPKEPEIDWDLVDPNIRRAYDQQSARLEEMQQRIDAFEEPLSSMQSEQVSRLRLEAEQAMDAASGKIQERFKLNDDELDQLANDAAALNIVPSLRAQGMAPQAALETALETAFWKDDKWRSRVVDEEIAARNGNNRRARASQVTGTSGGGAGDGLDSKPRTEDERRSAMAAEIAEALRGTA